MIKKTGLKYSLSVFGTPPKTCYVHTENLEKKLKRKYSVLVPDCIDGQTSLIFSRHGNNVDCYETNNILLNGGIIDSYRTIGLYKKIEYEDSKDLVNVYENNFYSLKADKKYDFVYCYRSLHLEKNKSVSMERKIKRLMSSVKLGGYLYIFYYMADDENDYVKYPHNQYLREYEIKKLFDLNNWNIEFCIENKIRQHGPHPYNKKIHFHKVGTILVKRINTRNKYMYHYIYKINRKLLNNNKS